MLELLIENISVVSVLFIIGELVAIGTVASIIMSSRSAATAWGWGMAVIAVPYLAIPCYFVFGRQEFKGYVERRREVLEEEKNIIERLVDSLSPHYATLTEDQKQFGAGIDRLSERRFTKGNTVSLLDTGEAAFDEMFQIIDSAQSYILVQFYILRDDELGDKLRLALQRRAREGLRVYLLYDEIGSHRLSFRYINNLRNAGVNVHRFHSTQGPSNRFQINFRNHRKMVIADGLLAMTGGHNIGDEYLGKIDRYGPWRDTSVRISGPAAMSLQMVFVEDWYWAVREIPELNWTQPKTEQAKSADMTVMILPFGPVEHIEGGTLFFLNIITNASERLWIASPYFVPDACIVAALQLAAIRGVDVRIMIPANPDKWLPYLASFSFLEEMEAVGVKLLRYGDGFMHQKALLVDDRIASVGTANLDNRSMRLNFEVNVLVLDAAFNQSVEAMFLNDFEQCETASLESYLGRPWWFRIGVKLARMVGPLL